MARARAGLRRLAAGESFGSGTRAALAHLPIQVQARLIAGLTTNMTGDGGARLAELAAAAGVVAEAERLCEHRRAVRRVRGVRVLTQVGAAGTATRALLDDPDTEVRAAAATWAAGHPDEDLGARLVAMLEDERPLCRFAAKDALLRMGHHAVGPLARRLHDPDGRVEDALEVAAGLADPALLPAALAAAAHGSTRRRVLAAEACTAIGGADAAAALERMLTDVDPAVRAAAARGLGDLRHWTAAAALATALRDSSWDVRRGAALALRTLGAPGELFLREALTNEDRFAADMARQVLGLPHAGKARVAA